MPAWEGVLWVAGGYLAGTLPSTYLVARARHGTAAIEASRRDASEADAHMLLTEHLGGGWSTVAGVLDVGKGLAYLLVARRYGGLPPAWLAVAAVAVVVGHCWPPYVRAMAGRGLAAASGVLLALLPIEMAVAGAIIVVGILLRVTGLASTLALAFNSCLDPNTTLRTMSRPTMTPVETSPIRKLTTVTATSMRFIGSCSCANATAHADGAFSAVIWFGP